MKKRYFLLSALAAAAVMPGTASANLVLDMPPILAGGGSTTCTSNSECYGGNGVCCNSKCYSSGVCCSGSICYTTCVNNACQAPKGGKLNDTGITTSQSPNDDAKYGRDVDSATNSDADGHAGFSFTKSGNCITDNVTGLTWSPDQGGTFAWSGIAAQVSSVNTAKLCGYSDWRAPAVKELVSIVSYHRTSPAVDNAVFTDMGNAAYWTSTPNAASSTTKAWVVNFVNGNADNTILKSSSLRLRLVRP